MNVIKQKLQFEESLKQRLKFICEFSKVNPTFINGIFDDNDNEIANNIYRHDFLKFEFELILTFLNNLCIINIGNDNSTNVALPK